MLSRILVRSLPLLAVAALPVGYYCAPTLKNEWSVARGWQAFQSGDFQTAVDRLATSTQDLERRGYTKRAAYYRGVLVQSNLALSNSNGALLQARWLVQSEHADSKAHFALGLEELKTGNWDKSVHHLKRVIELEPDCTSCAEALKNAEVARDADRGVAEARQVQAKAIELMTPPATCIAYLATVTAASVVVTTAVNALHPSVVDIVRKTGVTKRLSTQAARVLEGLVSQEVQKHLGYLQRDHCPQRVTDDASYREVLDWVDIVPFGADTHRLLIAGAQIWEFSKNASVYGRAFSEERDRVSELDAAQAARVAHWNALEHASRDPQFIDRALSSLAVSTPAAPSRWLDFLKPTKWF